MNGNRSATITHRYGLTVGTELYSTEAVQANNQITTKEGKHDQIVFTVREFIYEIGNFRLNKICSVRWPSRSVRLSQLLFEAVLKDQ